MRSRILGLGTYVPDRVVTNDDLTQYMETSHEWIVERTGIEQRHWVSEGQTGADLAEQACRRACANADVALADIDLLIYATLSPDHDFPGTGVFAQRQLGLDTIAVLDIRQQCSGFIYGLSIADAFIKAGTYTRVLLVGSEVHSNAMDISTRGRDIATLFGDGAGAALLGPSDEPGCGVLSCHLHADGREAEILWMEKPGCMYQPRITAEDIEAGLHFPHMDGRRVFKHAVTRMPESVIEAVTANGLTVQDIDMLIPHQANLRINEMVAKQLGLPPEKCHNNIQKYGNTTSASIPLCMEEALALGKIKRGDLVCLTAFGAGLTWASALMRY
ncbi:MAG: beta-ketoacyl-ACP synthase III [Verrucomicrobiota bacterium]